MKRTLTVIGLVLLVLSLAANALLASVALRAQREYTALAKQFVKTKQELQRLQAESKPAQKSPTASAGAAPATTPAAPGAPAASPGTATATAATPAASAAPTASANPPGAAPAPTASAAPAPAAPASPAANPGVEALRSKYTQRLGGVQATCEGDLNGLMAAAKAEYDQARKSGTKVDVAALGAKYFARADTLRRQCDRLVEGEVQALTAELKAAGLPLDLAAEVRETYEARIAERQAEIMAKAP